MSDDRSERLRQRRRQSHEKGKPDETGEQSEPSKPSETADSSDQSVKDERVGTYMYLAEEQKKDVNYLFGQIQNEYEYEYDEEFEKNRHFYPLLIQYGLDSLDSFDVSDIKERLDDMDLRE